MSNSPDLEYGLKQMSAVHGDYQKAEQYLKGTATEIFSTDILRRVLGRNQQEFSFNYARTVVLSRLNRMELKAITTTDESANQSILQVWEENQLDQELHDAFQGALTFGDAYLAVWPNEDGDGVDVFYNSPETTRVFYDAENPRKKLYAIKRWVEGDALRVNIYYPDRIEKYISNGDTTGTFVASNFEKYIDADDGETWPLVNPFGQIPIFHLRTGRGYGRPEHHDAYGPQNAINKLLAVQISGLDYNSYPQRYFLQDSASNDGVADFEHDFGDTAVYDDDDDFATSNLKSSPGGVWSLKNIKAVGEFTTALPATFIEPFKMYVTAIATVTETPMHLFEMSSLPSGAALRAAEAPLNKRVEALERMFGATIKEMAAFILDILGYDVPVEVSWAPPATYDDRDVWETAQAKHDAGVPVAQTLIEAGYTADQVHEWYPKAGEVQLQMSEKQLELLATSMQRIGTAVSLNLISAEEGRKLLPPALIGNDPAPVVAPPIDKAIAAAQTLATKPQAIPGN